jgi:ABC-type multidrug transport system fused ATPase/permease subunit
VSGLLVTVARVTDLTARDRTADDRTAGERTAGDRSATAYASLPDSVPAVRADLVVAVDGESPTASGSTAADAATEATAAGRAGLRQLWPYLRPHRRVLSLVVAVSLLGAVVAIAQPAMVGIVIADVGKSEPLGGIVALLVVLILLGAVIRGLQQYLLQRTAEAVVLDTRRLLVARLLRLPIREYDTRRTGDLVSRVGSDTTLLRSVVTSGLVDAVSGSLIFVGSIVAMALISPMLLGLTLLVVAVAVTVVVVLGGRIQKLTLTSQTQVGALAAGVARAIPGIRTIRAAGATQRETVVLDGLAGNAFSTGVRLAKVMALIEPVIGIALQGAFIVVLGVGGYLVAAGTMQVAGLVSFILYLFMMIMPLGQVFNAYTATQNALGAVIRIEEITSLPEEEIAPAGPAVVPAVNGSSAVNGVGVLPRPGSMPAALSFHGVSYGYSDVPVLREVSFTVPRGSKTAIVGPSGAGKSTLLSLIERFYEPDSGTIRLAGVEVSTMTRAQTRSNIGYVEQDSPVLAGTIRENLLLGAPDADDAACEAVLASVNLTPILRRDPAGLDAQVGEDGILLSGGERQRLAIARALLSSPQLLLLDEPTASLDGRNERALRKAIDAVAQDRTLIVVAHRLATVVDADQILVLEHGEVQAVGTHLELVDSSPLYRELAAHQLLV